jgi:mRNA-degrading endonuclease RelE of RelBE toxin-antitoxin system
MVESWRIKNSITEFLKNLKMKTAKQYPQFITELKQNIIQSRYHAAGLANREQLLLYLKTGKMLAQKIDSEKWGAKVVNQISEDLQRQLPGLKGFSRRNLMKMNNFIPTMLLL